MSIKVTAAGYTAFFQTKQRFVKEVIKNIDDRFPADSMTILDSLGNGYKCCWTAMERKQMAGMVQSLLLLINKQLGLNGNNYTI